MACGPHLKSVASNSMVSQEVLVTNTAMVCLTQDLGVMFFNTHLCPVDSFALTLVYSWALVTVYIMVRKVQFVAGKRLMLEESTSAKGLVLILFNHRRLVQSEIQIDYPIRRAEGEGQKCMLKWL